MKLLDMGRQTTKTYREIIEEKPELAMASFFNYFFSWQK